MSFYWVNSVVKYVLIDIKKVLFNSESNKYEIIVY